MKIYKVKPLIDVSMHSGDELVNYINKELYAVDDTDGWYSMFVPTGLGNGYVSRLIKKEEVETVSEADINRLFDSPVGANQEIKTYEEHKKAVDEFTALESVLSALSKNAKNIEFK